MKSALTLSVAFLLSSIASCWAQASEAQMQAFPMPPQNGYSATSTWNQQPYYGYFLKPYPSRQTPGAGAATDYSYVAYWGQGTQGTTAVFWGAWGNTVIPPPEPPPKSGDSCYHAHVSYGVWALVLRRLRFFFCNWGSYYTWTFVGGGGLSGERDPARPGVPDAARQCRFKTNNVNSNSVPALGWGKEALVIDTRQPVRRSWYEEDTYIYFVVGVLNSTHGWGTCGTFACIEPGWILGYAVY
jgi:hypothetical protein